MTDTSGTTPDPGSPAEPVVAADPQEDPDLAVLTAAVIDSLVAYGCTVDRVSLPGEANVFLGVTDPQGKGFSLGLNVTP